MPRGYRIIDKLIREAGVWNDYHREWDKKKKIEWLSAHYMTGVHSDGSALTGPEKVQISKEISTIRFGPRQDSEAQLMMKAVNSPRWGLAGAKGALKSAEREVRKHWEIMKSFDETYTINALEHIGIAIAAIGRAEVYLNQLNVIRAKQFAEGKKQNEG